jgi:F0F1-type ATP synthase assembly protein I
MDKNAEKTEFDELEDKNFNSFEAGNAQKEKKEKSLYLPDLKPDSIQKTARKSGYAMFAGINLVGSVLFFLAIGYAVDLWLQTAPVFLVIGIILGAIVGFYQLIKISAKLNE